MTTLIDMLWNDVKDVLYIDRAEFESRLAGWQVTPVVIDGVTAFATMTNGPEFHCHSFETGKPIPRKMLRDFIDGIVRRYGYALTRTPKEDVRQHRFNKAFGFEVVGEDAYDVFYRIGQVH